MGFNSVVFICNDGINEIDKDPRGWWQKTWQKLALLPFGKPTRYGHGSHTGAFQAVWNQHADVTGVILVGQNHATVLGSSTGRHHTEEEQLRIIKDVLREKGYTIRKLPK